MPPSRALLAPMRMARDVCKCTQKNGACSEPRSMSHLSDPTWKRELKMAVAPALIVAVFNTLFGEGFESALNPALWLLGGALLGAVAGFFWARRRAGRTSP